MFGKSKNKNGLCSVCSTTSIIIGVLGLIGCLAALIGVFQSHFLRTGIAFGTTSGSLSLIALAFNLVIVKKASDACGCSCSVKK